MQNTGERMRRVTIAFDGDEYRVPGPDGREATAYYTNDKEDAIGTARHMYAPQIIRVKIKRVEIHPEA